MSQNTWHDWERFLRMEIGRAAPDLDEAQRDEVIEACCLLWTAGTRTMENLEYDVTGRARTMDPDEHSRIAEAIRAGLNQAWSRLFSTAVEVHASLAVELARARRLAEPDRAVRVH